MSNYDTLFIIGNGFDKHHQMKTGYDDFARFLKIDNYLSYRNVEHYLSDSEDFWGDFEANLAMFDDEYVISDNEHFIMSYGSDDWSDSGHHDFEFELDNIVSSLTGGLKSSFVKWVKSIQLPTNFVRVRVPLEINNSFFLTFNYTHTLEKLYSIPEDKILHIHGDSEVENDDIILGHGWSPNIRKTLSSKADPERDDTRLLGGFELVDSYFEKTFKNSTLILKQNARFFEGFKQVKNIYVLGHSLSDVDMPYFKEIDKITKSNEPNWYFTNYKSENTEAIKKLSIEFEIPNERCFNIEL